MVKKHLDVQQVLLLELVTWEDPVELMHVGPATFRLLCIHLF